MKNLNKTEEQLSKIEMFYFLDDRRRTKNGKVMRFKESDSNWRDGIYDDTGNSGVIVGQITEMKITEIVDSLNDLTKEIRRKEKVLVSYVDILERTNYWENPR